MPLQDYTNYFADQINGGRYAVNTVEEAKREIDAAIDEMKTNIEFEREQFNEYVLVDDEIEGIIEINADDLQDNIFPGCVEEAFYIKAILKKFPELQKQYSMSQVDRVIEIFQEAFIVAGNASRSNIGKQQNIKKNILSLFYDALDAASSIK